MPPYYRQRSVAVTKFWVVEAYDFKTAADCDTFVNWLQSLESGKVNKFERDFNTLRVVWNL